MKKAKRILMVAAAVLLVSIGGAAYAAESKNDRTVADPAIRSEVNEGPDIGFGSGAGFGSGGNFGSASGMAGFGGSASNGGTVGMGYGFGSGFTTGMPGSTGSGPLSGPLVY